MRRSHFQLFLIFTANFFITCVSNCYFLFGPFYEDKAGATAREVGLFFSVYYIVVLLCRPVGSAVMERLNIKRTMTAGALLSAAAAAGVALSLHNTPLLMLMRALTGVGCSVMHVAAMAALPLLLDDATRGIGTALFTTGSMLPIATAVPLCEWFISMGWDAAFVWSPVFFSVLCAAASFSAEDLQYSAKKIESWGSYTELFRTRGLLLLLVTVSVLSLADAMTVSIASLAKEILVPASCFMAAEGISSVFIRTAGFRLISGIPRTKLEAPAVALMGLSLAGASACSSYLLFAFWGLMFGFGIGIAFPTSLSLAGDLLPPKYYPKATGLVLLVNDIGWFLSPMIFGQMSPLCGAVNTFRIIGIFAFAAASLLYILFWRRISPAGK